MQKLMTGLILALVIFSMVGEVEAQKPGVTPEYSGDFSGLPIDLLPPGARALGLGGAFTAVADDATAALANPGGLTNLTAPEVSAFVRYTDSDVDYFDPDAYNSALIDFAGDLNKRYSDDSTKLSFASFVYPFERWVISGFYSNQLGFQGVQKTPDAVFDEFFLDEYTNVNAVKAEIENYGVSGAFRITDEFSAGVTIRNSKLDLRSSDSWRLDWFADWESGLAQLYYQTENPTLEQRQSFLGVVNDRYDYSLGVDDSDNDLAIDFGLYYRTEQWSFGLVYHSESKFKLNSTGSLVSDFSCNGDTSEAGSQAALCQAAVDTYHDLVAEGTVEEIYFDDESPFETTIRIPRVISLGAAWRPAETWLISFDMNFIEYSKLNGPRETTLGFELDVNDQSSRSEFFDPEISQRTAPLTERIKNGTQFNLGVEKSFVFDGDVLRTLAFRGGVFSVQDHDGIVDLDTDDAVWTVGIGSTWGKNELGAKVFQLDLGASFASNTTNVVLSGILRF